MLPNLPSHGIFQKRDKGSCFFADKKIIDYRIIDYSSRTNAFNFMVRVETQCLRLNSRIVQTEIVQNGIDQTETQALRLYTFSTNPRQRGAIKYLICVCLNYSS